MYYTSLSVRRRSGQEGTDADISNAQTGGVGGGERRGQQRDRNETRKIHNRPSFRKFDWGVVEGWQHTGLSWYAYWQTISSTRF